MKTQTVQDVFDKMDWDMFRKQKFHLLKVIDILEIGGDMHDREEWAESLTGLLHLIDAVQNAAVDELGVSPEKVYLKGAGKYQENWDAREGIVYVPEREDAYYTYQDFLDIVNGNATIAQNLFDTIEWQHPSTLFEEGVIAGEWDEDGNILDVNKE